MTEKLNEISGGEIEKTEQPLKRTPASEALLAQKAELIGQGAASLDGMSKLLQSEHGEDYAALVGAITLIYGLFLEKPKQDEESDENEGDKKGVEASTLSPLSENRKNKETRSKVEEITKRLKEKRQKAKKPEMTLEKKPKLSEKFKKNNVFCVGDSYMASISSESDIPRRKIAETKLSERSRPFVAFGKNGNEKWGGNDVETVAHQALDNPECKLLVLTGGLNDFFTYGNPRLTYERVLKAYRGIIKRAKERPDELGGPVKVVIYKIPKIRKIPRKKTGEQDIERKNKINMYTDKLNSDLEVESLLSESSRINLIDTNKVMGDNWGDTIHPNKTGYLKLYEQIEDYIS
ncbi:SGNH/GDSL hydrolase family protein [Candidatus Peregrinibacteria bacterium]|nr:SGNH/GDSL hydrolase family protein [Candidatus Peregrinibacteria bacterium]